MNKLIGNTPLIKLNYKYNNELKSIYAKLEWYNLSGSVKDRMVDFILLNSKKNGKLLPNQTIVETTSGNTGISLSALGAKYGHKVVIYMPESASIERIKIMKLYGAEVNLISIDDGGFNKCIELANKYAIENNAFLFNQFNNILNIKGQESIGEELKKKLGMIDYFVSGIGSGGTAMGVANILNYNKNFKLVVVEPEESQILIGSKPNKHKIEGIGDDFIPSIVDISKIDKTVAISSNDAVNICKKLSNELGLGVGISSGANVLASILINDSKKIVATIMPDNFTKYLSTDLSKYSKFSEIVNNIKFINYELI